MRSGTGGRIGMRRPITQLLLMTLLLSGRMVRGTLESLRHSRWLSSLLAGTHFRSFAWCRWEWIRRWSPILRTSKVLAMVLCFVWRGECVWVWGVGVWGFLVFWGFFF